MKKVVILQTYSNGATERYHLYPTYDGIHIESVYTIPKIIFQLSKSEVEQLHKAFGDWLSEVNKK